MIVCQAGERGGRAGAIFIWRGPRPRGVQQCSHCRPQRSTAHRQSSRTTRHKTFRIQTHSILSYHEQELIQLKYVCACFKHI